MTRYTVVWHHRLERQAVRVWMYGRDHSRDRLDAIATALNFALSNDPDQVGEPLGDVPDIRGWTSSTGSLPFYAEFKLRPPDRQVEVRRITFPPKP